MVDLDGKVIGQHTGIIDYTIGQRKGLGAFGQPMFVLAKDAAANRLVIGPPESLFNDYLLADKANWIVPVTPGSRVHAKIRYSAKPAPCRIDFDPDDPDSRLQVTFDVPQRAITPGQLIVFYQDTEMLGGATIRTGPTDRPA
jgi:tRNA-specific 2-thiouridylase